MSQPTLNAADITVIDSADSTTNWSQVGQMGPVLDNDFFQQGSGAVGIEFKNATATTGTQGTVRYNNGSPIDLTGKHIRIWAYLGTEKSIADEANFGMAVRVYDAGGSNWGDWVVAGSDFGNPVGWKLYVIDCDAAFTRDSGTPPAKTAIQYFGMNCQVTSQLSKANGLLVDQVMVTATADSSDSTGGVLEITTPSHTGSSDLDFNDNGGSDDTIVRPSGSWITDGFEAGDDIKVLATSTVNGTYTIKSLVALTITLETGSLPADEQNTSGEVYAVTTLQDIVTQDQVTDDTWFGHIQKDVNGSFLFAGKLVFGDISGALDCVVRDSDQAMIWADNLAGPDQYKIIVTEDTGHTELTFGTEVGTGDDSRGVGGGFMTKFEDAFTFDYNIKSADAGPEFNAFGMTINGAAGLDLSQTGVQFVSSLISNSGQIILSGGAEMREGFIVGSTAVSGVGAILLNANPTDPEFRDMSIINCIHGIESETNGPTTLDLRNISFAGNVADIRFNHTSGLLTVNVLEGGDTPSTSDGGGGGTISVINAVILTVQVNDESANPVEGATVRIERVSDGSLVAEGSTNASGTFTDSSFNFVSDTDVLTKVRLKGFKPFRAGGTIISTGLSVGVTFLTDSIVDLP